MGTNIMVNALAGTGKTFCVTEGVHRMVGARRKTSGSDEQVAIWEAMCDTESAGRIHMTSFTNDASDQLAFKGPMGPNGKPLASSNSTYSMGCSFGKAKGQAGYIDPYNNKYRVLTNEFLGGTKFEISQTEPGLWDAVFELQSKARLDLKVELTAAELSDLADWYSVDIPDGRTKDGSKRADIVLEGVNSVLEAGRNKPGTYDFVDMVYLPVVHDLVTKRYDTLIVDEAQDMGKAQQEICLRSSYRRIVIGDVNQAIFGFAGADADAFGRLRAWLEMTLAGLQEFPLNMTRRCAKSIVTKANQLVPDLVALPDAPEGDVVFPRKSEFFEKHLPMLMDRYKGLKFNADNFMVICPTNAPLISMMFGLSKKGIKAFINGGDITSSMLKFVAKHVTIGDLIRGIEEKLYQIESKKNSKNKQTQLDIYDALLSIVPMCTTVSAVKSSIEGMFSDTRKPGYIELSSIHKAKGREADTVVVWNVDRCYSPYSKKPWQHQQDKNLHYVADTRAKTLLYEIRSTS